MKMLHSLDVRGSCSELGGPRETGVTWRTRSTSLLAALAAVRVLIGCSNNDPTTTGNVADAEPQCAIEQGADPDSLSTLGCAGDYEYMASQPSDASIPGATSVSLLMAPSSPADVFREGLFR